MKKYFILAAVAVAFAACSNNESDNQVQNPDNVIRLNASVGEITRAATAIQGAAFDADEDIYLEMTATGYDKKTATYTTATASEGKNALTVKASSTAFTWPANGTIAIKAFYPYVDGKQVTSETASFSVEENQSTDDNYKKSDLMYSNNVTAQAKQATAVGLTFKHALTKIIVNLTAGTGVVASDINNCTVTLSAKKTAAITSGVAGTASTASDAATITAGLGANNAAIIVPQEYAANADFITVTTAGNHSVTFKLTGGKTFDAGKVYTYNLTVNMSTITLQSTTISDWDPQTAVDDNVTI